MRMQACEGDMQRVLHVYDFETYSYTIAIGQIARNFKQRWLGWLPSR